MEIDRHVELLGALVDRPEPLVVEEHAAGQPVHHGALEAVLGHGALELVGRSLRIVRGQRREGREALGVGGAGGRQPVVGAANERRRAIGRKLLRRGRAMRDHLHVDADLVHFLEAKRAEIEQPVHLRARPAGFQPDVGLGQLGVPVVLFDGDDRAVRLLEHFTPLAKLSWFRIRGASACHDEARYEEPVSRSRQSPRPTA